MLYNYMFYFILYSFFGWAYESLFYTVQFKRPVNTGFLRGCFCPIYGIACVCNVILLRNVHSNALVFMISMLAISLIEYVVSCILENVFDKRWWNYSDWPLNIKGRISLISSVGFGVLSLLQIRVLHPLLEKAENILPDTAIRGFVFISAVIIFIDLLWSIKNMNKNEEKLWFVHEEPTMIHKANEKISSGTKRISKTCSSARQYITDKFIR